MLPIVRHRAVRCAVEVTQPECIPMEICELVPTSVSHIFGRAAQSQRES